MDDHGAGPEECVNPYCDCSPCHCAPCRCGLVLVGRTNDEQWDATNGELRYTVTSRYRHDPRREGASPGDDAGGHPHGPVEEDALGDAEELLADSSRGNERRDAVLDRRAALPSAGHGAHPQETVRTALYRGHAIEIRTSYQVTIDGEALSAHLMVNDEGNVHYHGLPNYSAASAIELMERVIDSFPEDYPPQGPADEGGRR
jgi:hypothetical protein